MTSPETPGPPTRDGGLAHSAAVRRALRTPSRLADLDDPLRSIWATGAAYRFLTLLYALFVHAQAVSHYTRPFLATVLIVVECAWSAVMAWVMFARPGRRVPFAMADQVVTLCLMYLTWFVAPRQWWDHNQSLPTTMWAVNAVIVAGLVWGMRGGVISALAVSFASLHVGDDLSWAWRSPTIPVVLSVGVATGVAAATLRRGNEQLSEALAIRVRAAERERLARQVHDGVLQVLALVAHEGARGDARAAELGGLAAEQERALRRLIATADDPSLDLTALDTAVQDAAVHDALAPVAGAASTDVRARLLALGGDRVRVSTGPDPVRCEPHITGEIVAAVRQCLVNTERHAPGATSYVLLEDLDGDLVVTVRDDGPGIPEGRLDEARAEGRLGVSASIIGRVEALGGRVHLETEPDAGVEWEFTVPLSGRMGP